jgi:hypothetical protein
MNRPQRALLDQQIIAAGLAGDHVIVTGRVSDTDFSALYGLCRAHILPTYCEGFGPDCARSHGLWRGGDWFKLLQCPRGHR